MDYFDVAVAVVAAAVVGYSNHSSMDFVDNRLGFVVDIELDYFFGAGVVALVPVHTLLLPRRRNNLPEGKARLQNELQVKFAYLISFNVIEIHDVL